MKGTITMKKTLMILTGAMLLAAPAMASKARKAALGSAVHLTDTQSIFTSPHKMMLLGDFASLEFGDQDLNSVATTGADPDAEGGFIRSIGDSKLGVMFGHGPEDTYNMRATYNALIPAAAFLTTENIFEVFYGMSLGDMKMGVSFGYSASDKKSADNTQNGMGTRVSIGADLWSAYANIGLGSSAKHTVSGTEYKYTGKSGAAAGGRFKIDTITLFADYNMYGSEATTAGTSVGTIAGSQMKVGMENVFKKDSNEFFYGASLKMDTSDLKDFSTSSVNNKKETTTLPVIVGFEHEALSWLTMRGSITQSVLLGTVKNTPVSTGTAVTDTTDNGTTVAAGAGFKLNKGTLDMVLTAANSGDFKFDDIGAKAGLTYWF
jgi:hypothetical protein